MGGSCISRPRKFISSSDLYLQKRIENEEQIRHVVPDSQIPLVEPCMMYPYFQPSWNVQTSSKNKIDCNLRQLKKKIDNSTNQIYFLSNLLPCRFYSYSNSQSKKMLNQSPKQLSIRETKHVQQLNSNLIYRVSLAKSLSFASHAPLRLQINQQTQYIIMEKESIHEFSEVTENTKVFFPKLLLFKQPTQDKLSVQIMTKQQQIKKKLLEFNHCVQTKLNKNCLINGILFSRINGSESEQNLTRSQIREDNETDSTLIYELLNIIQQTKYQDSCEGLLCYINPLIEKGGKEATRLKKYQYTSYVQFKALIEEPYLDLTTLFQPQFIINSPNSQLPSIYILLFSLKVFIQSHKELTSVPIKFLTELLTMREGSVKIISNVMNTIKLFYAFAACEKQIQFQNESYSLAIINCCKHILQITLINSHVLIDAYFIEFGVEIDEKNLPIRQNPLFQPQQTIKFKCLVTTKPNLRLINSLKLVESKFKPKMIFIAKILHQQEYNKNIQHNNKRQQLFQNWIKESLQCIDTVLTDGKSLKIVATLLQNKSNDFTSQDYTIDIILIMQYFFAVRLHQFIYQALVQTPGLFMIKAFPSNSIKNNGVAKLWENLIDQFMSNNVYNYCSAELAITILTIDGLVKNMQNPNMVEQNEQVFTKALQIWLRIYRDPRAKYESFLSNSWIIYIIKILREIKNKNSTNPQNNQDVHYLNNILQCFYCRNVNLRQQQPQSIQWILDNIPIVSISGILYSRVQLFLPPQDEFNTSIVGVSSSLIESLNDNLSSKSNFSDSFSNVYSDFGKIKKKSRRKIFDCVGLSQSRALRNGVYQWGKGVNSEPLLYPLTKNLDVYKIACGNYHVVVASSVGIYGWGQNGSNQLGDSSTDEQIKTIKLVLGKRITSGNQVDVACGNQHTAILFREQPLVMFGQHEGGIISGRGHIFDSVCCGGLHTLGIRKGKVYSWGRGEGGQLGHRPQHLKTIVKKQSTVFYLDEPKMINSIENIKKTVCGDAHSVLLTQNGEVYVFGFCYQGQLGLGLTGDCQIFQVFEPVHLEINCYKDKINKIIDIFAGSTFTFFKTANGDILSCGLNDCNQLGQQKMMRVFQKKNFIRQNPVRFWL